MPQRLVFVLFVLVFACRPPTRVLIIETARHCNYCARQIDTTRDSFSVRVSAKDVRDLGLQEFAGPAQPLAQSFTAHRLLDSLKLGRGRYAMMTYVDACDSCLAAPVPFKTGTQYACQQCGKTYSRDIKVRKVPRRVFKGDSIQTVNGVCGARVCKLRNKHPDWSLDDCQCIIEGHVRIGFTKDQAIAGWGRPEDINRTTGSWGTHEQWVYGGHNYLYFENGILTSLQN
jgi:predicted RNA-binding Zn-ribbon protein involved in translation (DUF1610 family)